MATAPSSSAVDAAWTDTLLASAAVSAEYTYRGVAAVLASVLAIALALHLITWIASRISFWLAPFRLGDAWAPPPSPTEAAAGAKPSKRGGRATQPVVLITGGAMGIGRELATRYARLGYHVVAWDVCEAIETLDVELKALPGVPAHTVVEGRRVDVTSDDDVAAATRDLHSRKLRPDLLVLNAAIANGKRIISGPHNLPRFRRLVDVNVYQLYCVAGHVLPLMLRAAMEEEVKHGRPTHRGIVVMGSIAGFTGVARMTDYCASKAAANIFAEALSSEIRVSHGGYLGTCVTLVCPYQIATGMFAGTKPIRFFSELKPAAVADAIVHAVRHKKEVLVMPYVLFLYNAFKCIFPWSTVPIVDSILGGSAGTRTFVGRGDQTQVGMPSPGTRPFTPAAPAMTPLPHERSTYADSANAAAAADDAEAPLTGESREPTPGREGRCGGAVSASTDARMGGSTSTDDARQVSTASFPETPLSDAKQDTLSPKDVTPGGASADTLPPCPEDEDTDGEKDVVAGEGNKSAASPARPAAASPERTPKKGLRQRRTAKREE